MIKVDLLQVYKDYLFERNMHEILALQPYEHGTEKLEQFFFLNGTLDRLILIHNIT